jgi:hypothetical protein
MQITLFRALQEIKIAEDEAEAVVDRLETHMESVVDNHIKAVEARLAGLQASVDSLRFQIQFVGVMLGIVGLAIAAGPLLTRLLR